MSELYLASFLSNIAVCSFSCCCSISFLCLKLWCSSREGSGQSCNAHHGTRLPITQVAQGFQHQVSHCTRTSRPSEFTSGFQAQIWYPILFASPASSKNTVFSQLHKGWSEISCHCQSAAWRSQTSKLLFQLDFKTFQVLRLDQVAEGVVKGRL